MLSSKIEQPKEIIILKFVYDGQTFIDSAIYKDKTIFTEAIKTNIPIIDKINHYIIDLQEIANYCEQKGIKNNDLFEAIGYSLIQYDYESNNNINHLFELISNH